jgi:hypothetical protein
MTPPRHWEDPVNAIVGAWILMSPWMVGFAMVQVALANAVIVGTLLFTVSVAAAVIGRPWVEFATVTLGAWMLASPWVLGFDDAPATWASFIAGVVALALGAGALVTAWHRRRLERHP